MRVRSLHVAMSVVALVGTACVPPGLPPGKGSAVDRTCEAWANPSAPAPKVDAPRSQVALRRLAERCLRLNQIQVMGSHNSYHIQPEPALLAALAEFDQALADSLEYTAAPLATQLSDQEIRQLELDLFADPEGGRYADRHVMPVFGRPLASGIPALDEPGLKVMHVQEVDFLSHCWTFVECLEQLRDWSDANPGHLPIMVMIEPKDDVIPDPLDLGFVQPLEFGFDELLSIDAEIRSVFTDDRLVTPDDVRGDRATLEEAVLAGGWPTLGEAKGRFMFTLLGGGATYRQGAPTLEGRVMFTNSRPGQPDAAFMTVDDPLGSAEPSIGELVAAGYVVRTRSDVPTIEARSGDTTRRDAALASGAQWVSTDYPVPGWSPFSDFFAAIPDGDPARCNPVNTGPACRNDVLEHLG